MSATIVFGGHEIDLLVAEQALRDRSDVEDAVAVGVDDAFLGQALNVWVVLAPGTNGTNELRSEMLAAVDDCVGVRPRGLRFADRLPRASDGRPARATITALLNGAPLDGLDGADDLEALDAVRRAR